MISKINGLRFFSLSAIVLSLLSSSFIQNSYALLDGPTSSAGTTIDCSEEAAGFQVTASLLGGTLAALTGDTFELLLVGSSFPTPLSQTLTATDILATQVVFTISAGQLGSDGTKTITSKLTKDITLLTELSQELTLTLDTSLCTLNSNSNNLGNKIKTQIFQSLKPTISFVQINGFTTNNEHTNLESIIQTQHFKVDEPFDFSIQFPADQSKYLREVQLYLNLRETQREVHQSDTYIQYSKFKPLVIMDPHGYFSNVDVKEENVDGFLNYKFNILFDKPMKKSNLVVQYIDEIRNFKRIEFPDALQVVEYDFHSPNVVQLDGVSAVDKIVQEIDTTLKTALKETLTTNKQKQIEVLSKWSENGKKIEGDLFQLINSPDPDAEAKRLGLMYKDGKTKVIVGTSESKPELLQGLQTFGQIDFISDEFVQMNLDLSKLSDLVEVNEVQKIRIPHVPIQNEFHVSGVESINADMVHFAGITGRGVKVAVIDFAFDLKNPKISPNIAYTKSFRYGIDSSTLPLAGLESEYMHGTAVTELIVDTAPNAKLFLYTIGNDLEFAMALKDAIENKIDIITIPLGWANLPTDGTSYITNNVNAAVNEGIVVVVPSGNLAQSHWEGKYADENSNGWNEFTDNDEGLTFNITPDRIKKETPLIINLLWDNENAAGMDFDMVLINPSNEIVSFSANVQNTQSDTTFEQIRYIPSDAGTYSVGIVYDGSHENPGIPIEIFSVNDELEHYVTVGSVIVPADADNIIVTGAVNVASGKIEPFSSQGPTNNGYAVPHVLAPNGVSTIAYGDKLFYGTSAAAPYVAGIAALVLEIDPTMSLEEILKDIKENTIPQSSDSSIYCDKVGQCGLIDAELIVPWEKIR